MRKKPHKIDGFSCPGNHHTSFSTLLDVIDPDPEGLAQREEHLKRTKETAPKAHPKKPKKPRKPTPKAKAMGFEEKLEKTQKWLQETFPDLFDPSQPCKALDVHIVRDIKAHYKNGQVENKYPSDLVIKAALYRYMETPEYLACLEKGAPRYNIEGEVSGSV